jgi:hypothetical protein
MTQRFASQRLSRRSPCSHRMKARLCQSSEEWSLRGMKTSSASQTGTAAVGGMKGPSACREATGETRRNRPFRMRRSNPEHNCLSEAAPPSTSLFAITVRPLLGQALKMAQIAPLPGNPEMSVLSIDFCHLRF